MRYPRKWKVFAMDEEVQDESKTLDGPITRSIFRRGSNLTWDVNPQCYRRIVSRNRVVTLIVVRPVVAPTVGGLRMTNFAPSPRIRADSIPYTLFLRRTSAVSNWLSRSFSLAGFLSCRLDLFRVHAEGLHWSEFDGESGSGVAMQVRER